MAVIWPVLGVVAIAAYLYYNQRVLKYLNEFADVSDSFEPKVTCEVKSEPHGDSFANLPKTILPSLNKESLREFLLVLMGKSLDKSKYYDNSLLGIFTESELRKITVYIMYDGKTDYSNIGTISITNKLTDCGLLIVNGSEPRDSSEKYLYFSLE